MYTLKKHFHDVRCNYNILAVDIIWISETRLKSVDITEHYTVRDFKRYRLDQPKTLNFLPWSNAIPPQQYRNSSY